MLSKAKPITEFTYEELRDELWIQVNKVRSADDEDYTNVIVWINMIIGCIENQNWKRGFIDGTEGMGGTTALKSIIP